MEKKNESHEDSFSRCAPVHGNHSLDGAIPSAKLYPPGVKPSGKQSGWTRVRRRVTALAFRKEQRMKPGRRRASSRLRPRNERRLSRTATTQPSLAQHAASSAGSSNWSCTETPAACPDRRSDAPSAPSARLRGIPTE